MGHIPAKADTEKQRQWVTTKLAPVIKEAQRGECQLLFMDAAHFILQPFICALWCMSRLLSRLHQEETGSMYWGSLMPSPRKS